MHDISCMYHPQRFNDISDLQIFDFRTDRSYDKRYLIIQEEFWNMRQIKIFSPFFSLSKQGKYFSSFANFTITGSLPLKFSFIYNACSACINGTNKPQHPNWISMMIQPIQVFPVRIPESILDFSIQLGNDYHSINLQMMCILTRIEYCHYY